MAVKVFLFSCVGPTFNMGLKCGTHQPGCLLESSKSRTETIIAIVVSWKHLNTFSRSVLCILPSETC